MPANRAFLGSGGFNGTAGRIQWEFALLSLDTPRLCAQWGLFVVAVFSFAGVETMAVVAGFRCAVGILALPEAFAAAALPAFRRSAAPPRSPLDRVLYPATSAGTASAAVRRASSPGCLL